MTNYYKISDISKEAFNKLNAENKQWYVNLQKIHDAIGLPVSAKILCNADRLEIGYIKVLSMENAEQFCKQNKYGTYLAKVKSPLNVKWLSIVKELNLKYNDDYRFFDAIDFSLILHKFHMHELKFAKEVVISSNENLFGNVKNLIVITEAEYYDLQKRNAELKAKETAKNEK